MVTKQFTRMTGKRLGGDNLPDGTADIVVPHTHSMAYKRYSPHMIELMEGRFAHCFPDGYVALLKKGNKNVPT